MELLGLFPSKTFEHKTEKSQPSQESCCRGNGRRCGYFVRQQLLQRVRLHAGGLQLLTRLLRGLPLHQGFSLGQEVGSQDLKDAVYFNSPEKGEDRRAAAQAPCDGGCF